MEIANLLGRIRAARRLELAVKQIIKGLVQSKNREFTKSQKEAIEHRMATEQTRYILIFPLIVQAPDSALIGVLQQCALLPLLPTQLSEIPEQSVEIPLVIIDRPSQQAAAICGNLRKQPQFSPVPILVLVDEVDEASKARLSALNADIIFKPVKPLALQRYISLKLQTLSEPKSPPFTAAISRSNGENSPESGYSPKDSLSSSPLPDKQKALVENGVKQAVVSPSQKSTKRIRISELAKELKLDAQKALEDARREGADVSAPANKISLEIADRIRAKYSSHKESSVSPPVIKAVAKDVPIEPEQEKLLVRILKLSPKEQTQTQNQLENIIPSSSHLLSSIFPQTELPKGGLLCSQCRRWPCRREDVFCSRCGKDLAILAILNPSARFEPRGNHTVGQLIEFKNDGLNPVRLTFRLHANSQLETRFQLHTQNALLEGGSTAHLLITFDARGLDLTISYRADLEIITNEKGRSTHRLELIVERLAIPKVASSASYSYVLGGGNEWEIQVTNDGGGSLRLLKAYLDNTPLTLSETVSVRGGRSVDVRLATPELELSIGTYHKKLRCEFEHYAPVIKEVELCVIRPPRLAATPTEIDFGVISTKRAKTSDITIFNSGGEELIVESFAPTVHWLECLVQTPFSVPAGSTCIIDIQARGNQVPEGDCFGEIQMQSNSHLHSTQTIPIRARFVEPKEYEAHIGIDFGTTASCVSIFEDNHPSVIKIDTEGHSTDPRIMPSVLYFQENGEVLTGREALEQSMIQPANAVTSIKRVLGIMQHKKSFAGREYTATEMAAKIIEQLVARTEDALFEMGQYKTPKRAIVTVPVEFSDNQRRALLDACQLMGLEIESHSNHGIVIDEAHAAALYYLYKRAELLEDAPAEKLLIFDFGGGTLDCVLVEIEEKNGKILFNTLALSGNSRLGGEDIDWKIVRLLADRAKLLHEDFDTDCLDDEKKFERKYRSAEILREAYRTRADFKRQAEIAKITLGKSSSAAIGIGQLLRSQATTLERFVMEGSKPARLEVTLQRDEFEVAITPLIDKAVKVVETVCHRANLSPDEIDTILHVGRTSLIPMVRDKVNHFLCNAKDRSELIEPKLCVAMGAAFWGYIKDKPGANIEFIGATNRTLHDIGYIGMKRMQQVFTSVFAAQTEFPCEKVIEFSTYGQTIDLTLAENHGKEVTVNGNSRLIGSVRISTQEAQGAAIPVHFAINENRMLEITVNGQILQIMGVLEE
jgi:molecular chaperone DnaK